MGKSITELLIAKGCQVIAVDRDAKLLTELKESLVQFNLLPIKYKNDFTYSDL